MLDVACWMLGDRKNDPSNGSNVYNPQSAFVVCEPTHEPSYIHHPPSSIQCLPSALQGMWFHAHQKKGYNGVA
jgi:hypothetical protein